MTGPRTKALGSLLAVLAAASSACSALLGANDPIEIAPELDGASTTSDGASDSSLDSQLEGQADGGREGSSSGSQDSSMPPPDTGAAPRLLATSMGASVWGVTSDGWVIASDSSSLIAVPLAGGAPVMRFPLFPFASVLVSGTAAFLWSAPPPGTLIAPLWIWEPGADVGPAMVTATSVPSLAASGGGLVYYVKDASGQPTDGGSITTGTLAVATRTGVESPITVFPDVVVDVAAFGAYAPHFVSTPLATFFSMCTTPGPSGCSIMSGSGTVEASNVSPVWAVDPAGSTLLVAEPGGGGALVDTASGTTTSSFDVDGGAVTAAALSAGHAVYVSGGLLKTSVAAGPPVMLAPIAVSIWALTPQGDLVVYSNTSQGDVLVLATRPGGSGAPLAPAPAHAIGIASADGGSDYTVAAFQPLPPQGLGPVLVQHWLGSTPQGSSSQIAGASFLQHVTPNGRIVFDDNVTLLGSAPPFGTGDLWAYTSAAGGIPVTHATNLNFAVDPAGQLVVVGWDSGPSGAGIYAFPLP